MELDILYKIDLNTVVLIFLIIVAFLYRTKFNIKEKVNKIYIMLVIVSAIVLILEILDAVILQYRYEYLISITKTINVLGFMLSPVVTYLWLMYVVENLDIKCSHGLLLIPTVFNFILSVGSYSGGYIFEVTLSNIYVRGPLFFVPILITYIYFLITMYLVIRNRYKVEEKEYKFLILFEIIPIIAMFLQVIFIDLIIVWASVGISIIIYYLYIQEKLIRYDSLTGVWNRFTFESYATNSLINKKICFSLIYVDLDDFKSINDTYGHDEGDIALKNTAKFLKEYFIELGKVVRMGGDEFVILAHCDNVVELDEIMYDLKVQMDKYNKSLAKEYNISFSCGYDIFDERYDDLDSLLKSVDELMYNNKRNKKEKNNKNI